MMLAKSCPKCRGDLRLERDLYGGAPDLCCLQCGYTVRPEERATLLAQTAHQQSAPTPPLRQAS